jgi:hypothetical protein
MEAQRHADLDDILDDGFDRGAKVAWVARFPSGRRVAICMERSVSAATELDGDDQSKSRATSTPSALASTSIASSDGFAPPRSTRLM